MESPQARVGLAQRDSMSEPELTAPTVIPANTSPASAAAPPTSIRTNADGDARPNVDTERQQGRSLHRARSASRCLSSRSSHRLRRVVGLRTGHREAPRGRGMSRGSELTRGAPLTDIRATNRGRRRSAGLAVGRSRHRDWPQRHGGSRRSEAGRRQVPGEVPERPRGRARRLSAVPKRLRRVRPAGEFVVEAGGDPAG